MSVNNLFFHYVIGRGGFGKVIFFFLRKFVFLTTILYRCGKWKAKKQNNFTR